MWWSVRQYATGFGERSTRPHDPSRPEGHVVGPVGLSHPRHPEYNQGSIHLLLHRSPPMCRCTIPLAFCFTLLLTPGAQAQAKARLLGPTASNNQAETRMELSLPELGRKLLDIRAPQPDGTVLRTTVDAATR